MKDIFNRRQRFSLRKYSIGVCSVLLGTALFAAGAQSASADEAIAAPSGASTSASTESASDSTVAAETTASSTEASYDVPAANVDQANTGVAQEVKEQSEANKAAAKAEEATKPAPKAEETVKPAKAEEAAKPAPKAEAPKATATSEAKKADEKSQAHSAASEAAKPYASTSAAASENSESAAASEAATPTVALKPKVQATSLRGTLDRAATDMTNGGALAMSRSRRNRRAATDHNNEPVAVATFLKDGEVATPEMTDPNGASVRSQTVPSGYAAKEGDVYTYSIVDLTKFNQRYNTNYYTRAYKRFDASTDTTVELIDKNTGNVVETRTITASSGIQKFTTTTAASRGELTWQVDYDPGTGSGPGKTDQPFIQLGYEVGASIQALVNPKNEAEQKLYQDVYNARTSTDIINVVEPAYNGRTITDTNAKIPVSVNKTTYYKVVDKNNPTFNANKTDVTVQDYKANGNEVDLASYTLKAMEGQNFTASGERQFDGYKLYQAADANDQSGYVSRPYKVGTKFMDAERAGIKRIKEIVGEDGTVVVRVYLLDPKQQSKRSDGTCC